MALIDQVVDTSPANDDEGVALRAVISITLSGLDYDETSLLEGIFLEGPDTDQFVGPGQIDLVYPANVSQGDVDDFFASPGRRGIVQGVTSVSPSGGNTVVTFTPTLPLAALIPYTVTLGGVYEFDGITEIAGFVTLSFISGSGSIVEIPSSRSSSPLLPVDTSQSVLSVTQTTPVGRSVENDYNTTEIIIVFNKALNDQTIAPEDITVAIEPVSDHPAVSFPVKPSVPKAIEITTNTLKIRV